MSKAMHRPLLAATLLALAATAYAAPPKVSTKTTAPPVASAKAAQKLSPADQKRMAAIEQYQHDLVTVVALRADPSYLLGAAILARPFKTMTPGLDFDALSARAASTGDAAAEWERLDVCKAEADCPNKAAFAGLKQHAAANAAVWLIDLDMAAKHKDHKAELAALKHAAAAQTYDDYYGKALAGVAKAVGVLPPLPDTTAGAHDGQPDNADGVRVLVAVNATQAHLRPNLQPLVELCAKAAVAKAPSTREPCLKVAHDLQWGSSPIGRAAGLHIQGELDAADQAPDEQSSRDLAWQVQQYSGLLQRSLTDSALAAKWLATARNGGTELSLILATLRANQIPTTAPASASTTGN